MIDTQEIETLAKLFSEFPGIGERQSTRFVYYLLKRGSNYREALIHSLENLGQSITQCDFCFKFFSNTGNVLCSICKNTNRDSTLIMIVEKDSDIDAIEKSHLYKGKYFVLGGLIPIATEDKIKYLRLDELKTILLEQKDILAEIILGFPVHPNGDYTTEYIKRFITELDILDKKSKISVLGRGLSTGTDLEYTDKETIKYALEGRG